VQDLPLPQDIEKIRLEDTLNKLQMQFDNQYVRNPDNLHKVRRAFEARSEYNEGLPILLHVEASGVCNLPCPLCPRGTGLIERSGFLTWEDFHRLFFSLSSSLCDVAFSGWGEPLLNKDTPKMIAHVVANGIPVTMNTNGVLLSDYASELVAAGLTTINISLDGAVSKATHFYAGDQTFDRVVEGVKKLREAKSSLNARYPVIHGQFLLDEETVDEIAELSQWAFQLDVDHVKFKRRHEIMPGQVARSKQRSADELLELGKHELVQSTEDLEFSAKTCAHPWESIFLACTGDLSICSWDPHQKINLGRVPKRFEDIWNGETVRTIRKWHSGETSAIGEPCRKCNRLPGYLRLEDAVEKPVDCV
jgi:radical SAM protein with 4Fe4S-binding SPASM domain